MGSCLRVREGMLAQERQNVMFFDLILLALLVLLTRLPFVSHLLYHWDSAQFGLALEKYNVALHQPHPPGYILYVALARLIYFLIPEANAAYVIISIGFSIGAVMFLYLLGRSMFSRMAGLAAATLFTFSPLFWGYGEVACAYTAEAFFSILIAYLAWLAWKMPPTDKPMSGWALNLPQVLLTMILGLAGGFRQGLVVFLLPLWVLTLWRGGWRKLITAGLLLLLVCLAWFLPQAYLSGGQKAYLGESLNQWSQIIWAFSFFNYGWEGLRLNLLIFLSSTLFALGFALAPLAGLGWYGFRNKKSLSNKKVWFIFWWVGPAILFYLLVHMRQPGYVLTYLAALYLLAGYFLAWLGDRLSPGWRRILLPVLVVLIAGGNFSLFVGWPAIPSSYGYIGRQEKQLQALFDHIRNDYSPQNTWILGGDYFRHVMYYLPQYQVFWLGPMHRRPEEMNFYHKIMVAQNKELVILWPKDDKIKALARQKAVWLTVPPGIRKVIAFDDKQAKYFIGGDWQPIRVGDGQIYSLPVRSGGKFILSYHHLEYVR